MAKIDEVLSTTVGGRLLMQFKQELFQCLTVPNELLPERLQDRRSRDGRTLASINRILDKHSKPSEAAKEKAERLRRVQLYTEQVERGEEISYEETVALTPKAAKKLGKYPKTVTTK